MKISQIKNPTRFVLLVLGTCLGTLYLAMLIRYLSLPCPTLTGWTQDGDGMLYCQKVNQWAAKRAIPWTVTGWVTFAFAAITLSIGSLFGVDTHNGQKWPLRFPGPIITTMGVVLGVITLYSLFLADTHNRIAAEASRAQKTEIRSDSARYDMCVEATAIMYEKLIQSTEFARASTEKLLEKESKEDEYDSRSQRESNLRQKLNNNQELELWKDQSELLNHIRYRLNDISTWDDKNQQQMIAELTDAVEFAERQAKVRLATTAVSAIETEKKDLSRELGVKKIKAVQLDQQDDKAAKEQLQEEMKKIEEELSEKEEKFKNVQKAVTIEKKKSKEKRSLFCISDRRASTTTREHLQDEPETLYKIEELCQTAAKEAGSQSGVNREAWRSGTITRKNGENYDYWCSCIVKSEANDPFSKL